MRSLSFVAATAGGIDAEEEAACKLALLRGELPAAVAERYRVDRFDVGQTFEYEIKNGNWILTR